MTCNTHDFVIRQWNWIPSLPTLDQDVGQIVSLLEGENIKNPKHNRESRIHSIFFIIGGSNVYIVYNAVGYV